MRNYFMVKIVDVNENHVPVVSNLFPKDWNLDFYRFISFHSQNSYFKGYTLLDDECIIGFGCLFIFKTSAWLGNIVVDEKYRGRGLGRLITSHLVESGQANGVETFNLTATSLGQPVYEKVGFEKDVNYEFYVTQKRYNFQISDSIRKSGKNDLEAVFEIDYQITGDVRAEMLKQYLPYMILISNRNGEIAGFSINGPDIFTSISTDPLFGLELVKYRLNSGHSKIVVPETNTCLIEFLLDNGFNKENQLQRMILGKRCEWNPKGIFNRGAGYCG